MPMWAQINMQDANSPIMEQMMFFNDYSMMILTMITIMVLYMMMSMTMNKFTNRYLLESQKTEMIWTIMPTFILIFIAMPSLKILYLMEEINNPIITIKAIGHQWYWSYEYSDFKKIEFDSYMMPNSESHQLRLLDVDNRIIIPMNTQIRMLITASDVLHSWTIPSLGVKVDATPGRLNQTSLSTYRPEIMFGQCSEICGANHSFMPISMESINMNDFIKWLKMY
nr:cytochrome c oxidase subunit II [Hypselosoma matsumurae]